MTRPDIAYAASLVGPFTANPSTLHWKAVHRKLRYIRATTEHCLLLGGGTGKQASKQANSLVLTVYADADFAGEIDGMQSTSSFTIIDPYGATVNWRSLKQSTVAKSTADTEFNAIAVSAKEGIWLQKLQRELYPSVFSKHKEKKSYIQLFNDNQAYIASLMNGKFCASTRHVGVRYFWLKEIIETGEAEIEYMRTDEMVADGLTKALEKTKHELFIAMLGMY